MGYYAYGYAELDIKPNIEISKLESAIEQFVKVYGDYCGLNPTKDEIVFEQDGNYHEEDIEAFCLAVSEYVLPGESIELSGEDDSRWRYTFTGRKGDIQYESAMTIYASDLHVYEQPLSGNPSWSVTTNADGIVVTDENGNSMLIKPLY